MFDHDDSLSVSVYLNDEGIIVGVMVYDANSDLQSAVGLLPLESINEERSVLGVPEIGLSTFLPASEIWA